VGSNICYEDPLQNVASRGGVLLIEFRYSYDNYWTKQQLLEYWTNISIGLQISV